MCRVTALYLATVFAMLGLAVVPHARSSGNLDSDSSQQSNDHGTDQALSKKTLTSGQGRDNLPNIVEGSDNKHPDMHIRLAGISVQNATVYDGGSLLVGGNFEWVGLPPRRFYIFLWPKLFPDDATPSVSAKFGELSITYTKNADGSDMKNKGHGSFEATIPAKWRGGDPKQPYAVEVRPTCAPGASYYFDNLSQRVTYFVPVYVTPKPVTKPRK